MSRIPSYKAAGPRGFTVWHNPSQHKYLMACCDCGLVHEMQFKPFRKVNIDPDGAYDVKPLPRSTFGVAIRVRRANGHTVRLRREMGGE